MDDYLEKISFGKIKGKLGKNKYAVFHETSSGKLFGSSRILTEISYGNLVGYLMGVSSGKTKDDFCLYNGISSEAKKDNLIGLDFIQLKKNELEKLLEDSLIDNLFSVEDVKGI